jgi:Na+/H+ antiporter NhaD/arsenite permease-like protein
VLLVAPVTILICERLDLPPAPYLISLALASNIGGTATLIGDPPNIIIASKSGLSFNDFLINLAPIAALALAVFVAMLPLLFRGSFSVDPERVADIMALEEREAIKDRRLLIICGIVLAAVFAGFIGHAALHIEPSVVALLGAGLLVLLSRSKPRDFMPSVEWETLLFFIGLFIMIGALVKTGVIGALAEAAARATGGDALVATMLILFVSAILSGIIDNIPYVAAMSPIVLQLTEGIADPVQADALWWSLAIGADFGGNLTAIGASANVVILGIAKRSGYPITFWGFTKTGAIVTVVTILLAAPYLWLRYFVIPS